MKVLWVASHPIQYQAPFFRALARKCKLQVAFLHRQSRDQQAEAGYGVPFDWDVDLLDGYSSRFLSSTSSNPSVSKFWSARSDEFAPLIREVAPDAMVIGGWNLFAYWQALQEARGSGVPTLVRTDSGARIGEPLWRSQLRRALYPLMLRQPAAFLCAGSASRKYLTAHGVPASRVFVCPHTVDVGRFHAGRTPAVRRETRRAHGIDDDALVIAFAGRMVEWKRPFDIVRAVARSGHTRNVVILLIGDGPLLPSLRKQAATENTRVVFIGFRNQEEMPRLLAASDILVIPSNENETWGLVANEALAAGCALVLSDAVGCAPELGLFHPSVQTYPMGDIQALAGCLERSAAALGSEEMLNSIDRAVASFEPDTAADVCLDALSATCLKKAGGQ